MSFRILSAARFANTLKMTGRTALEVSAVASKNYKTLDSAIRSGLPQIVSKDHRRGDVFVVIEGPNGQLAHRFI